VFLNFSPSCAVYKEGQREQKNNDIEARRSKSDRHRTSSEEHSGMSWSEESLPSERRKDQQ